MKKDTSLIQDEKSIASLLNCSIVKNWNPF